MIENLKLADKSWPVSFFVLGEMAIISPLISSYQKELRENDETSKSWDILFDIITFTIKRSEPEFTKDNLLALATTQPELMDAFYLICKQSGRRLVEGEAKGPAAPNPTGNI